MPAPPAGRLLLIPWHIGDQRDVTIHALQEIRRLRVLVCEDPAAMRRQLSQSYQLDCTAKTFDLVEHHEDPALLARCRSWLQSEDVGVVASSGAPCFVDPGAWLVRSLRADGFQIQALTAGSALTTMLSLSGIDWSRDDAMLFTFYFFTAPRAADFSTLLAERRGESILAFLPKDALPACLEAAATIDPTRPVTIFFDLSKNNPSSPLPDTATTAPVSHWLSTVATIPWPSVSDISLLFHPTTNPYRKSASVAPNPVSRRGGS
jgi:16S rRNA C1402 (ribose-2'-O) methylase RsmI